MSKPSKDVAEGRANTARPSLRFLPALLTVFVLLVAPAAQAEAPRPLLTDTNPESSKESPAASTEPFILGEGEPGIITQGLPRGLGPLTSAPTQHPEYEIEIFDNASCQGEPVAIGSTGELEGPGIEVVAAQDAVSQFSAKQIDPADQGNPSVCSAPLKYWQGNPPPEEETPGGEGPADPPAGPGGQPGSNPTPPNPPRLRVTPGGRANQNAPRLTGTAAGADAVKLFANTSCNGSPFAKVSPTELAAGVSAQVADNSLTSFSGVALANGGQSACSSAVTYVEDSAAPRTRITMGPGVKTRRRKAVFRFANISDDPPGTTFLCKVDRKKWKQCHSPFKLRNLGFRSHVLRIRGIDTAGNTESKGAKRRFKVIRSS